jgi:hypothetical protein
MKINVLDNHIHASFDNYGCIYFSFNEFDSKSYQLNINARNKLYLDYYDFNIQNKNVCFDKKFLIEQNKLKKKAQENINLAKQELEDEEDEIYVPEDEDLFLEGSEVVDDDIFDVNDGEETEGSTESTFEFYNNSQIATSIKIMERDVEIDALYNSYVYEDNKLVSMARSCFSGYIIKLYNTGVIQFRPIGGKEINYRLTLTEYGLDLVVCD